VIQVADDQPVVGQRFSAAHEMAHFILRNPGEDQQIIDNAKARVELRGTALRHRCRSSAATAREWMISRFGFARSTPYHRLGVVHDVARPARVSLAAAAVRLRDVPHWRRTLLHWTFAGGQWLFEGEAGVFVDQQGIVSSTLDTEWVLTVARGHPVYQRVLLPLALRDHPVHLEADLVVRADRAVALIQLPTAASLDRPPLASAA
jgi:hypothetical protein